MSDLGELSPDEIEAVKALRKEKLKNWSPPYPGDISASDKLTLFNRVYSVVLEMWNYRQEHGYSMKDEEHWCYEALMELLDVHRKEDEPSIWDRINGRI